MTPQLLYGHDKLVCSWVGTQLGVSEWLGDAVGIGVIRGTEFIAGVVYFAYRWPVIEMACAAVNSRWLTRPILYELFRYPFEDLQCRRICALVDIDNLRARKFDEKLGFVQEAVLKEAHPGGDVILYRMLKSECRWLDYGREILNNQSSSAQRTGNSRRAIEG